MLRSMDWSFMFTMLQIGPRSRTKRKLTNRIWTFLRNKKKKTAALLHSETHHRQKRSQFILPASICILHIDAYCWYRLTARYRSFVSAIKCDELRNWVVDVTHIMTWIILVLNDNFATIVAHENEGVAPLYGMT